MKLNNNDDSHNSGLNLLIYNMLLDIESHPTWVCGLKLPCQSKSYEPKNVTPYVGVWIETVVFTSPVSTYPVTPYVGVWIETVRIISMTSLFQVTPYVGVWIET